MQFLVFIDKIKSNHVTSCHRRDCKELDRMSWLYYCFHYVYSTFATTTTATNDSVIEIVDDGVNKFRVSRNENWKTRTFKVSFEVVSWRRRSVWLTSDGIFFTINDRILPFRVPWLSDDFITKKNVASPCVKENQLLIRKMAVKVEIQFCGGWGRCTLCSFIPFQLVSFRLDLSIFLLHHILRHHVV